VGFAFVDDKDLLKARKPGEKTYVEMAEDMQNGLDLWEGLLKATGGALVPDKSYWYLIDFKGKNGAWKFATTEETEYGITIEDHTGDLQLCHRGDVFLTEVFIQHGLKGTALKRMNACRLYL
jgi:hypothetical protein